MQRLLHLWLNLYYIFGGVELLHFVIDFHYICGGVSSTFILKYYYIYGDTLVIKSWHDFYI